MIDQLKSAICKTIKQFQEDPLDFLSESDIQALLFVELRSATNEVRYPYAAEPANRLFGFTDPFSIHPVTTEYHVSEGKFDIAVLSEKPDTEEAIWRQPCCIGIEIKLWQPREREPKYLLDVEKLQRYQAKLQNKGREFMGIAMLFVHPYGTAKPTAITEEKSGDCYPENGIALHLIKKEGHWWKQFAAPSVLEQGALVDQTL
jgi:hypothetical protein